MHCLIKTQINILGKICSSQVQFSKSNRMTLEHLCCWMLLAWEIILQYFIGTTPNSMVEGRTVTVYGVDRGSYSYTSQANYQLTAPSIDAKNIDS
jgi:hypothetical protein